VPGSRSGAVEGRGGSSGAARPSRGQHGCWGQRQAVSGTVSGFGDVVGYGRRCQVRLGSRVGDGASSVGCDQEAKSGTKPAVSGPTRMQSRGWSGWCQARQRR
jgi:hypothetical protein